MGEKQYEPVAQVVTIAPAIDYDASLKAPSTKQSTWSNPSWRQSLIGGAIACLVVFLTNLAVTIWSIFLPNGSEYGAETGRRIMFEGSCEESRNLSIVLHLVINILGTVLLAASNYCMQCLSAPNRDEVDRAHAKNQWLDIGILSFRNLRRISRKRAVLWWLLVLSSVPLHLLYNSVVFSSLTNYDYSVFTVDDRLNLPEHLPFFTYTKAQRIEHTWNRLRAGEFDNLTNIDCMAEYATAFQTSRNHVMLVSDPGDDWDGKSEIFQEELAYLGSSWVADCPPQVYEWICPTATCQETCRSLLPEVERNADDWRPYGYRVKYCLSEPRPQLCRLNFSVYLAAAVLAVNLFKALIIAYVAFRPPKEPLFILGDAIQSFMVSPDAFSEGSCLASADMIRKGKNWMGPHPLSPARRRWAAAVSRRRWIFSSVVYDPCFSMRCVSCRILANYRLQILYRPRSVALLPHLGHPAHHRPSRHDKPLESGLRLRLRDCPYHWPPICRRRPPREPYLERPHLQYAAAHLLHALLPVQRPLHLHDSCPGVELLCCQAPTSACLVGPSRATALAVFP